MSDQRVLLWWLWWNFQKESLDWGCYINNVTIVQYFVTGTLRLFMFDLFISSHYNNFQHSTLYYVFFLLLELNTACGITLATSHHINFKHNKQ